MGLLQLSNHVVQNHQTEEQMTHWDMFNKVTKFEFSLFHMSQCVVCSPVWRFCTTWLLSCKSPLVDEDDDDYAQDGDHVVLVVIIIIVVIIVVIIIITVKMAFAFQEEFVAGLASKWYRVLFIFQSFIRCSYQPKVEETFQMIQMDCSVVYLFQVKVSSNLYNR